MTKEGEESALSDLYTTHTNELYYLVPYNCLADVVRLLAGRSNNKYNINFGGF